MCLITPIKEPMILQSDLTVYKIISVKGIWPFRKIFSSVHGFLYKLNKLYETEMTLSTNTQYGFSDFTSQVSVRDFLEKMGHPIMKCQEMYKNDLIIAVLQGFHAASTPDRISYHRTAYTEKMIECIYPKGSTVYVDGSGLLVSNKIILKKILKDD